MVRLVLKDSAGDLAGETAGGAGMNTPILPTNGALMTDEQYDDLRVHVTLVGSSLEKAMLCQMKAMLAGVKAWKNARDTEWNMRMEAETDMREIQLAMRKAHTLLSATNGKTTKPKLLEMVQQALDELDVFEVAESAE